MYFNKDSDTVAADVPASVTDATKEQIAPATDTTASSAGSAAGAASNTSGYKDGTYTAVGSYRTPESTEEITVTLTLQDGVITDTSAAISARAPESRRFQNEFVSNYKQYVVGKNIDTLSLSQVSGSSLTSGGFNEAVAQIKLQAQG